MRVISLGKRAYGLFSPTIVRSLFILGGLGCKEAKPAPAAKRNNVSLSACGRPYRRIDEADRMFTKAGFNIEPSSSVPDVVAVPVDPRVAAEHSLSPAGGVPDI